jgi:hypothetical protein
LFDSLFSEYYLPAWDILGGMGLEETAEHEEGEEGEHGFPVYNPVPESPQ